MKKDRMKSMLAGLTIAGLATGISMMASGCKSSCGQGSCGSKKSMDDKGSCGKGSTDKASCGKGATDKGSCGQGSTTK